MSPKDTSEKGEVQRYSITLYQEDIDRYTNLKERKILPAKSLSGMIRYLLDFADKNPHIFKKVDPTNKTQNTEDLLKLYNELVPKESEKDLEWKSNIELMIKDLANNQERLITSFQEIKKDNSLGGKM